MTRIITAARRQQIADARLADPDALGPILGELVIEGNVPVGAVAQLMGVSAVTVYRWMYGTVVPREPSRLNKLERLLTVLRKAKRAHTLPLGGSVPDRIQAVAALVIAHRPAPKAAG